MLVDYVSDLHVNHYVRWDTNQIKWEKRTREWIRRLIENGNGEVLVLAGDFSEWNIQSLWVLDECSKYYNRIYFTFGNHDLYIISKTQKRKYGDSLGRLNELIEKAKQIPNVVPLIKNIDVYKGKTFAGDTMWYLPKTQEDWSFYREVSNDSNYIFINGYSVDNLPRTLYKNSMNWYDTLENIEIDIFVSHVPPVHPPITKHEPNGCYMTNVPFINTKHWICGHMHEQGEFEKIGVKFYMNAIGYPQHYANYRRNTIPNGKIDDTKEFGIKTFEI